MAYKKYFWILYFIFILIFEAKSIYNEIIFYNETMKIELNVYMYLFSELIALVGLFGYAFNKVILNQKFWLAFAFFFSLYSIYFHYSYREFYVQTAPDAHLITISLITIIAFLPWYISLFLYGKYKIKS